MEIPAQSPHFAAFLYQAICRISMAATCIYNHLHFHGTSNIKNAHSIDDVWSRRKHLDTITIRSQKIKKVHSSYLLFPTLHFSSLFETSFLQSLLAYVEFFSGFTCIRHAHLRCLAQPLQHTYPPCRLIQKTFLSGLLEWRIKSCRVRSNIQNLSLISWAFCSLGIIQFTWSYKITRLPRMTDNRWERGKGWEVHGYSKRYRWRNRPNKLGPSLSRAQPFLARLLYIYIASTVCTCYLYTSIYIHKCVCVVFQWATHPVSPSVLVACQPALKESLALLGEFTCLGCTNHNFLLLNCLEASWNLLDCVYKCKAVWKIFFESFFCWPQPPWDYWNFSGFDLVRQKPGKAAQQHQSSTKANPIKVSGHLHKSSCEVITPCCTPSSTCSLFWSQPSERCIGRFCQVLCK